MPTLVVLAMHGAPPTDFPRAELGEYFRLHAAHEARASGQKLHPSFEAPSLTAAEEERYSELDLKLRAWPRREENDPFYAGSLALAKSLAKHSALPVILGFNEFCAPSLPEAFDEAAAEGARRVVVITPMMTTGGAHSEVDIPAAIQDARQRYPHIEFIYAWPFSRSQIAIFLATHLARHLSGKMEPQGWR